MRGKLPYRREHTGSAGADRMQRQASELAKLVGLCPFIVAPFRVISVHFVTGGTFQTVNHGLGVPASCVPASFNYDAGALGPTFAEDRVATGLDPNNQSRLVASATCTMDLLFFPRASKIIPAGATQSP